MRQRNTVPMANRGAPRNPVKQSIDNQIPQLKEAIRVNLIRSGTLALNGRQDAAIQRAKYALHQYERLMALVAQYEANQTMPPKADQSHNPRPARTKTQVKAKSHKRWSDK